MADETWTDWKSASSPNIPDDKVNIRLGFHLFIFEGTILFETYGMLHTASYIPDALKFNYSLCQMWCNSFTKSSIFKDLVYFRYLMFQAHSRFVRSQTAPFQ